MRPDPDVQIDVTESLCALFLAWPAERLALREERADGSYDSITYGVMVRRAQALAFGLTARGLLAGDRIAIISENRIDFVVALMGAIYAGIVPVPVNHKLPRETVDYILRDSGAALMFYSAAAAGMSFETTPSINFDAPEFAALFIGGAVENPSFASDRTALQPYTSGSSGQPKGVQLGHEGLLWAARSVAVARGITPETKSLIAAPLYHMNALNTLMQTMAGGGAVVLLEKFTPNAYLDAIVNQRCSLLGGVPTIFSMVLENNNMRGSVGVECVRYVGFGSAPASETLFDKLGQFFPNARIENNFGVTEGGPVVFGPHPGGTPRPRNSVGYPLPGCEVRLEGVPAVASGQGELCVRNPGVMLGYHNQPEATAEKLINGWYRTGDLFRRDANGFYFFISRMDDMFVCGGENISPSDVAGLLERHPAVAQAAVLPVQDVLKGQVPVAFVVRHANVAVEATELKEFSLANGPSFAHPRRIILIEEMPLAGTGKIDFSALRKRLEAGYVANT